MEDPTMLLGADLLKTTYTTEVNVLLIGYPPPYFEEMFLGLFGLHAPPTPPSWTCSPEPSPQPTPKRIQGNGLGETQKVVEHVVDVEQIENVVIVEQVENVEQIEDIFEQTENVVEHVVNVIDENEIIVEENENIGQEYENIGQEYENIGQEYENIGQEYENVNVAQENESFAQENENFAQEYENFAQEYENGEEMIDEDAGEPQPSTSKSKGKGKGKGGKGKGKGGKAKAKAPAAAAPKEQVPPKKKPNKNGPKERRINILEIPALDKDNYERSNKKVTDQIHYIIFFLDPRRPYCFSEIEEQFKHIDPIFFARKRVDFWFVKTSNMTSSFQPGQLRKFLNKYRFVIRTFYADMEDQCIFQVGRAVEKLRRILANPTIF